MRLFVGLGLPDMVRRHVLTLAGGVKGARWQRDDQLHITLRFLGELDGAAAADAHAALDAVEMAPFNLSLTGVGLFGNLRHPRILWAGVEPADAITRLHGKVDRALNGAGLAPDDRKFTPHVTLARFGGPMGSGNGKGRRQGKRHPDWSVGGLGEFIEANAVFRTMPFDVDEFVLYSSFLSADGAIYRREAAYPLTRSLK